MLATRCLPIDWSWMPTRPSFSGPDPGAVALPWAIVVPSYSSEMIPSFLPTMLKCSEWHCRLIWQWTNAFPTSARPDYIGCENLDVFGGHWTRSRLQPSCTPSSRPASITITYCWLGHRRLQPTSYGVFWMLQHVFSVARRSLIVDCLSLCMSTFIGSMFLSEQSTNSRRWCITVSMARLLRTWPTAALLSQTLRHGVICVLPVVVNYSSLDTISPHMVVGLFLSRVRLPKTAWATKQTARTVANSFRELLETRLFQIVCTSAYGALEVLHFKRYTILLTYLFTYLLCVVEVEYIVAKRCVLKQTLLLTAYRKSYRLREIDWYQNKWPWPLYKGRLRSCQPLRHIRHWISRKPLQMVWFQRTTNRKWPMGNRIIK